MGLLDLSIPPPVVIHTIPHVPCQQQNLRLPRALQDVATTLIKRKLANVELSRYFLVEKMLTGKHRFINDVQQLNKVTIRGSDLPMDDTLPNIQ